MINPVVLGTVVLIFKRISDNLCLIRQNLLNEQNRDKLVNHISYKLRLTCD